MNTLKYTYLTFIGYWIKRMFKKVECVTSWHLKSKVDCVIFLSLFIHFYLENCKRAVSLQPL
jgi:hypothetical protein